MRKLISALFSLVSCSILFSQSEYLHSVWVLDEGVQDWMTGEMVVPSSVGVFNPESGLYNEVLQLSDANFTTKQLNLMALARGSKGFLLISFLSKTKPALQLGFPPPCLQC